MIPTRPLKWIKYIHRNTKIVGIFLSMAFAYFKAWDNRGLYIESNERLDVKNEELLKAIQEKNHSKTTLKSVLYNIAASNTSFDELPLPLWYKLYDKESETFKMVYINHAYEKHFNVNRVEYLGSVDDKVHGSDIAKIYAEYDWEAFHSRDIVRREEPSIDGRKLDVVKWRVDRGGEIFIYGIVTDFK